MRRREVVPGTAPRQRLLEGDVGVVVDRPVGVAVLVVVREMPVERAPVGEPVGADDTGVADVDHVGVRQVQPDAKSDEEHQRDGQPRGRNEQRQRLGRITPAAREHQHADEQVEERWIGERDGQADVPVREEGQ